MAVLMWSLFGIICFFAGRVSAVDTDEYQSGYESGWNDAHELSEKFYASEEQR